MDIRFFDKDINFLGEVDNFTSLFYISKWEAYGEFEFHVKDFNIELIKKGNIIMLGNDTYRTGVIEHIEVNQEDKEDITVKGFSLGYWLTQRITVPPAGYAYHSFNAHIEDIMIALVRANTADPADINRKIPSLIVEPSSSRGIKLEFQTRYKNLADELIKLSKTSGLRWTIALDYKAKKFVFKVLEGKDLTTNQNINPPQIFSVDYDNIRKENYLESNIGYKNMAYVAGQGEGSNREIQALNNNLVGFDRRETFIDARDIDGTGSLADRGKVKLAETPQISSYECEVDSVNFKKAWNLGDIVTTLNKKRNLIIHNRVIEVKEIWESDGYKVEPTFGTSIPLPGEKIKQIADTPLQESVQGPPGETGEKGPQGYSVQYLWDGTKLGIKREDEASYIFVDLKGAKGDIGPKGDQGIQGKSLEFTWNGTQLGVRLEGQASYTYVDLKGQKGDQGIQGIQGERGLQGIPGVQGVKGDKGDKINHQWSGTTLKLENPDGTFDIGVDLKGSKGDKGDQGVQGVQGPAGNGQSYVVFQKYFIATEGQKVFSWNDAYIYPIGINAIAVYINGIRIGNKAFKEASGNSIELLNALSSGDNVFVEAMQAVVDLQGPPGIKGDKGDAGVQGIQGNPGKDLEFIWNGTQLGVRQQGQATYTYVNLQGSQGIQGIQGIKGDTGAQGLQGVQGLKGDTGTNGDTWRPTVDSNGNLSWVLNNGTTSPTTVNIKGAKGADGITPTVGANENWFLGSTDTGKPSRGAQGAQGIKGDQGVQGVQGLPGKDGKDGTQIVKSATQPSGVPIGTVWI